MRRAYPGIRVHYGDFFNAVHVLIGRMGIIYPIVSRINRQFGLAETRTRGSQWSDWFESLAITLEENDDTLLTGPVVDQAALHSLLRKVRDMGRPVLFR